MMPIKNILYPVDFSDRCRSVWPAVVSMAKQWNAPVTLLHALHVEYANIEHTDEQIASAGLEALRERVQQKLNEFPVIEGDAPTVSRPKVSRMLRYGPPAECIVKCAEEMEGPLIMMPTRGQTRFRQLLLGSVTTSVLHDAACPVWTEAHTENGGVRGGPCRSIVCAIDMGPHTHEVLRAACEFRSKLGAELYVIHSVPGIDPRFCSGVADRAHQLLVANANDAFPAHCSKAGVEAQLEIVEDVGLVNGILGAVSRHGADLLIIGRGIIHGPLGRLRTNAHELIRRSPSPVLSV